MVQTRKALVRMQGEVFTPDPIVCDMLKLVTDKMHEETNDVKEYVSKTFLEPSCGTGNFLVRILWDKLTEIKKASTGLTSDEIDNLIIMAVASIYGVELLAESVVIAKDRMLQLLEHSYTESMKPDGSEVLVQVEGVTSGESMISKQETLEIAKGILDENIIQKDFLAQENVILPGYTFDFNTGTVTIEHVALSNIKMPLGEVKTVPINSLIRKEEVKQKIDISNINDADDDDDVSW